MNIQKFLDSKHGKLLGRVYFLILLFIGNALIPIGAVMKFLHNGSGVLMILGSSSLWPPLRSSPRLMI